MKTMAPAGVPLVSVIIPAHNAEAFLDDCLSSVQGQSSDIAREVIVVDDGSSDATAAIASRHAGVVCLTQPHRGPSAARNAGISLARGEFIAFLDADDLWPMGKLAAQLTVLQAQPDAALALGDCRQFDADGMRPCTQFEADRLGAAAWGGEVKIPDAYAHLLRENFITTGSVVARRKVLVETGGFAEDLQLVEDLDLWLRIAHRHPIVWCDHVCLLRRRHERNTSRDTDAMSLAYLEVLKRQWPLASASKLVPRVEFDRLIALEHRQLAERALARGAAPWAWQWAWRGMVARWSLRSLWQLIRASVMLIRNR